MMSFKDFKHKNDKEMIAEVRAKLVSPEIPAAVKPKLISNLDLGNDLELDLKVRIISMILFPIQKEGRNVQRLLINFIDEAGETLRGYAWGNHAEHFFKILKIDYIYTLLKGSVNDVKSSLNSPRTYCTTWMTWIQNKKDLQLKMISPALPADAQFPKLKWNFVPLSAVANAKLGAVIDLVGIVTKIKKSEAPKENRRQSSDNKVESCLILMDNNLTEVTIVITEMQKNGADAEKLIPLPLEPEEAIYKIIAFKRVMVIEKGNCLAFPDSLIEILNEDTKLIQAKRLFKWRNAEGFY